MPMISPLSHRTCQLRAPNPCARWTKTRIGAIEAALDTRVNSTKPLQTCCGDWPPGQRCRAPLPPQCRPGTGKPGEQIERQIQIDKAGSNGRCEELREA